MGWDCIARLPPSFKFVSTHLCTWVERDTVRVKCLTHEHDAISLTEDRPKLLDLEASTLIMRPGTIPHKQSQTETKTCLAMHMKLLLQLVIDFLK